MSKITRWLTIGIGLAAIVLLLGTAWFLIRAARDASLKINPSGLSISPTEAVSYLLICAVIGALTMALVQVWRTLLPIRGLFQRVALLRFLQAGGYSLEFPRVLHPWGTTKVSPHQALMEFEERSNVVHSISRWQSFRSVSFSLYDLQIEQLSGQLNLAFEAAIANPERFPHFLMCIVGRDGYGPLMTIATSRPSGISPIGGIDPEAMRNARLLEEAEARTLISRMGQQRIDVFQINAGGQWRRLLRLTVLLISLLFSWQLTIYGHNVEESLRMQSQYERGFDRNGLDRSPSSHYPFSGGGDDNSLGLDSNSEQAPPNYRNRKIYRPQQTPGTTRFFQTVLMGLISAYLAMVMRDVIAIIELKRRQT